MTNRSFRGGVWKPPDNPQGKRHLSAPIEAFRNNGTAIDIFWIRQRTKAYSSIGGVHMNPSVDRADYL